jgi:CheY-like chemotaxis protein
MAVDHKDFFAKLASGEFSFAMVCAQYLSIAADIIKFLKLPTQAVLLAEWGEACSLYNVPVVMMPAYAVPLANVLNGVVSAVERHEDIGVSFTAPQAKALVVDDNLTNLKISKEFLLYYQMQVDTCESGFQAITLAQQKDYDLIFVDHMMPGMDGVETTARLRALRGYADVPIIALTANVVCGMREMVLENGMNDFLPKPINYQTLDSILCKWLPAEKRVEGKSESAPPSPLPELSIAGVDVAAGLAGCGGSLPRYLQVLQLYCKDVSERLPHLARGVEGDAAALRNFIINVHALKSASASIGARELAALAAHLEEAGQKRNLAALRAALASFCQHLDVVRADIQAALADWFAGGSGAALNREILLHLRAALAAEDVRTIDAIIDACNPVGLSERNREDFLKISDLALVAEFQAAAQLVDHLLERI